MDLNGRREIDTYFNLIPFGVNKSYEYLRNVTIRTRKLLPIGQFILLV